MNLSCLPVSLFPEFFAGNLDIVKWAEKARTIGFDGFDISAMFIRNHTPTYLKEVAGRLQEIGLPLVMVCTYPDFTHPDPAQREREEAYLRCDMAAAAELGGKFVRVLAGQAHPGVDRATGVRLAVEGLRRAADMGKQYGVVPIYENHGKPGAWHYIDFSYPLDIFREVFEGIRDTSVMLNFDIGNVTAVDPRPGSEVELLASVLDKVATIHVSDMTKRGTFAPTLMGTGQAAVADVFSLLKKRGFGGWICIEEAGGMGLAGVEKAYEYVRRTWEKA